MPGRWKTAAAWRERYTRNTGRGATAGRSDDRDGAAGRHRAVAFSRPVDEWLHEVGQVPLPPYIHEPLDDPERYQTVYSRIEGSVASSTAGLHFTPDLLFSLRQRGIGLAFVTLHIGLDTFRPVKTEIIEEHPMHSEWASLSPEVARQINETTAWPAAASSPSAPRPCARWNGLPPARRGSIRTTSSLPVEACCGLRRRDQALHPPRLPLPRRRRHDHQLPPAAQHAADVGQRVRRQGADRPGISGSHRRGVPVLLVWRCDDDSLRTRRHHV